MLDKTTVEIERFYVFLDFMVMTALFSAGV
jgi:hypothetical protein